MPRSVQFSNPYAWFDFATSSFEALSLFARVHACIQVKTTTTRTHEEHRFQVCEHKVDMRPYSSYCDK
jgi:hypothetical protein